MLVLCLETLLNSFISSCRFFVESRFFFRTSLVAQMVKRLPTMQETQVQSLGQGEPLEKGMANHFSILAWRIPWTVAHQGSSVHGILQARILGWAAIPFSRGSP